MPRKTAAAEHHSKSDRPIAALTLILSLLVGTATSQGEIRLDVQAERSPGGTFGDGWQHVVLVLRNQGEQPITGRATLYEWESQVGARPRVELPFAVSDRQALHFYPFRPPEPPQPSSYLVTLRDDNGRPIPFTGTTPFVIDGELVPALRVDTRYTPAGDFRILIWGESESYFRSLINEWNPSFDELYQLAEGRIDLNQLNLSVARPSPEAIPLDEPRLLPDSYLGYGELDVLLVLGSDVDQLLTERQRRALADWVRSGGMLVYVPSTKLQLTGPFLSSLIDVRDAGEVTTDDDRHLEPQRDAAPRHRIVHFLTQTDRTQEVLTEYAGHPVVYSVPAGFGRVWIVGFDPDSHGGHHRYRTIWTRILNHTMKYRLIDRPGPAWLADHPWSAIEDRRWLAAIRERFGKTPEIKHLAILVAAYLLVVGPVNFFILKRREARPLLLGTVPGLAVAFGGLVLAMGYVSHGVRAATNQLAFAVVVPEGDSAFVEEYVGVYGTTSAEYLLGFPRGLPVRPLGEYIEHSSGGFESASSFRLVGEPDRVRLRDWRLNFWQTRATAAVASVALGGRLTASRRGDQWTLSNQTPIEFDSIVLSGHSAAQTAGPLKPFETKTITLPAPDPDSAATVRGRVEQLHATEPAGPEADRLFQVATTRLPHRNRQWVLGFTRQPVHAIDSPDAKRHLTVSLYAWPVAPDSAARN